MIQAGIRELKTHLSMYLREIKAGNTISITDRGDIIALMTPAHLKSKVSKKIQALVHSGAIIGIGSKPKGIKHPITLLKSKSLSAAILEDR